MGYDMTVCKKLTKNSQPFGKNFQKTLGGDFFWQTLYMRFLVDKYAGCKESMFSSRPGNSFLQHSVTVTWPLNLETRI